MKKYINDDLFWEEFVEMLQERIEIRTRQLSELALVLDEKDVNKVKLHRQQGRLYELKNLLKLRDEIRAKDESRSN